MEFHKPVLLKEILDLLEPKVGDKYIDATLGGGGHALELLKRGAKVLGIDRDQEAIDFVAKRLESEIKNKELILVKANFNQITEVALMNNFTSVKGILFDLGVSSHQLEKYQRGFSFQNEGPLDMRMDTSMPITAADIVNNFEERRIDEIFKTFGQEKFSRSIASAICSARKIEPIESTKRLAQIVLEVYEHKHQKNRQRRSSQGAVKINPATKVFQALRIVTNSELLNLKESLPQTIKILERGGRLVIISYHSLEDGLVKRFFKTEQDLRIITKKPIGPQVQEVIGNPRSRSAKLRAAEKI